MTLQTAAHGAAYTLDRLDIEVDGEVVKSRCERCKKDALYLKVDKTDQLLEIAGDVAVGTRGRVRASATDWPVDVMGFLTPNRHVVLQFEGVTP